MIFTKGLHVRAKMLFWESRQERCRNQRKSPGVKFQVTHWPRPWSLYVSPSTSKNLNSDLTCNSRSMSRQLQRLPSPNSGSCVFLAFHLNRVYVEMFLAKSSAGSMSYALGRRWRSRKKPCPNALYQNCDWTLSRSWYRGTPLPLHAPPPNHHGVARRRLAYHYGIVVGICYSLQRWFQHSSYTRWRHPLYPQKSHDFIRQFGSLSWLPGTTERCEESRLER